MPFVAMGVMSVVGVGFLISILAGTVNDRPLIVVIVVWCAILAWHWSVLLRVPYEIRFEFDRISFVALARTSSLNVADIRSIKPYASGGGVYVLRHSDGKIRLMSQFTGFHEVIARIKAANPHVDVVGI